MREDPRSIDEKQKDRFFYMWTLTDRGKQDISNLHDAMVKASKMLKSIGGDCTLHVALSGKYDFIGVAEDIDDYQALQIRYAVESLDCVRTTTFVKARDFYLKEFEHFRDEVQKLLADK
jgi:uncharacterized protein with GYD domain